MSEQENRVNTNEQAGSLSPEAILTRIDAILYETTYLHDAIHTLSSLPGSVGSGDIGLSSRCEAIGHVVCEREKTNRELLSFYRKLFSACSGLDLG